MLSEYKTLANKSSRLSGYYREKMDKNIQGLAQNILANKDECCKIIVRAKNYIDQGIDI